MAGLLEYVCLFLKKFKLALDLSADFPCGVQRTKGQCLLLSREGSVNCWRV